MVPDDWRVYRPEAAGGAPAGGGGLPRIRPLREDPAHYVAEPGLAEAVNVAILLGQPLLVTGEPGTGKTRLADSVAHQVLGPGARALRFHTKTTTTARDLLYQYDALAHFRDAQLRTGGALPPERYITYQALGLAILRALPPDEVADVLPDDGREAPAASVVLIDEIDKAPRDVPNDLLDELGEMRFEVRETGRRFAAPRELRPVVVMTSNSEKLLPEPFLRRCVFYHLARPGPEQLRAIVARRLGGDDARDEAPRAWMEEAIRRFEEMCGLRLHRAPSTGELLLWLRVLEQLEAGGERDPLRSRSYLHTLAVLAKTREDHEALLRHAGAA
jgi:MoxR-like ATPase